MEKGFSIIVCSFNPDLKVLHRIFHAINKLKLPLVPVEVIIIDNGSSNPLIKSDFVVDFLNNGPRRKCLIESNPGLTSARLRGVNEAKYEWIVFFDDDNEPEQFYLIHLLKAIVSYPQVGCWGPSHIEVELLNRNKEDWVQKKKELFQQRNWNKTEFGKSNIWQDYFPYGTGLVSHMAVLREYEKCINEGLYSLSDRKGKSLSSGGDLQIVLTATNMGLFVGTVKDLRINHLIVPQKSTLSYLVKQVYGTSSSYVSAHKQVDRTLDISIKLSSSIEIIIRLFWLTRFHLIKTRLDDFKLILADFFGSFNARYIYQKIEKKPIVIRLYEKIINA